MGETAFVSGTASSGLLVSLELVAGPCQASGQTLLAIDAGTCVVVAHQPGNAEWAPAPSVTVEIPVQALPVNACGGVGPTNWGIGTYDVEFMIEGEFLGAPACLSMRRELRCRFSGCMADDIYYAMRSGYGCWRGQVDMIGNDGNLFEPDVAISSGYGDELFNHEFDCATGENFVGIGPYVYLRLDPGGAATFVVGPFTENPWVGSFGY